MFKSWCEDTIYGLEFRIEKQRLELQKEFLDSIYNTQKTIINTNDKSCEILNDIVRTSQAGGDIESLIHKYQSPVSNKSNKLDEECCDTVIKPFQDSNKYRQCYDSDQSMSLVHKDMIKNPNSRNPDGLYEKGAGLRTERSKSNSMSKALNPRTIHLTLDSNRLKKDLCRSKISNDHTKSYIKHMNKKSIIPTTKGPGASPEKLEVV